MLYLIGVIITFFLAFILISKNDKTYADKILFFWLLAIGVHLFLYYLYFSNKYLDYPYLLGLNMPLPLIHGPFLYLYTTSVTNQVKNFKISILHFSPVLISYLSIIPFLQLPLEDKVLVYKNQGQGFETLTLVTTLAVFCSGIVYVIWSLLLLKKHKKNILNQFSYTERINLYWLRYLIYGIGFIWIFVLYGNDELIFSSVVFFVIFIGYFGINQAGVFTKKLTFPFDNENSSNTNGFEILKNLNNSLEIENELIKDNKPTKYVKSGLNQETAIEIHELLTLKMNEEQLFTNPELTLIELAQILETHPNNLSQVINTFEGKNFYDYINSKRIELFIKYITLPENKKYTLLSLAFDCGFNSKSSFNKYFKKVTNQTPSEYINSL